MKFCPWCGHRLPQLNEGIEATAVSISEAQRLLKTSRSTIYKALGLKQLVGVKNKSRILITRDSINEYIRSLPLANIAEPK